jgi:hypothetical protein
MMKAVLLLDPDGVALAPATLCAEAAEEARNLKLPLFDQVVAELSAGREMRAVGESSFELYEEGQRVALLEIFEPPREA